MKTVRISLMALVFLGLLSFAVLAQMSHSKLEVGKKGEIELKQPTKIGDTTLEPATYVVQHRVISARLATTFASKRWSNRYQAGGRSPFNSVSNVRRPTMPSRMTPTTGPK